MTDPLLSVENLTVDRGGRIVLRDLSFTLAPGDLLLVKGRNGAGKSTLLRTIAGFIRPARGRVVFGLASDDVRGVETAHFVGYEEALKPSLTVAENVAFWATMLGAPPDLAIPLAATGVTRLANVRVGDLSAGQKRRTALARLALASRPIWLLDEPLIALDREAQTMLGTLMSAHRSGGGAIVVASHQPLDLPCRALDLSPPSRAGS